jgi:uncharacterized protein
MAHAVVHFEVSGPDDRQLAEFYSSLLGWSMRPVHGIDYTLVDTCGGAGINGGIGKSPAGSPSVTFYIETDDLQAVLDKVNLLGGKTETPITELPGMVTFAKFEDLDGLVIGLVLGPGDPARAVTDQAGPAVGSGGGEPVPGPSAGAGAPADWFELLGSDADRSERFYTEIFGWQVTDPGLEYRIVNTGAAGGIQGGIGASQPGSRATVYARVRDVERVLARAAELGGGREYGPRSLDGNMVTGAVRDPAGNVLGVYSQTPH